MGTPLKDDVWTRRGISLLWDDEQLAKLCSPQKVISLRHFFQLHAARGSIGHLPDDLGVERDEAQQGIRRRASFGPLAQSA